MEDRRIGIQDNQGDESSSTMAMVRNSSATVSILCSQRVPTAPSLPSSAFSYCRRHEELRDSDLCLRCSCGRSSPSCDLVRCNRSDPACPQQSSDWRHIAWRILWDSHHHGSSFRDSPGSVHRRRGSHVCHLHQQQWRVASDCDACALPASRWAGCQWHRTVLS